MKRKKRKKQQFPNPFNDDAFRDHFAEAWTEVKTLMDASAEDMLNGPWPRMNRFEARLSWMFDLVLRVTRHRHRLEIENRDIREWSMAQTFADLANRIEEADMEAVTHEPKEMTDEA